MDPVLLEAAILHLLSYDFMASGLVYRDEWRISAAAS
jgi:hypothetical protein